MLLKTMILSLCLNSMCETTTRAFLFQVEVAQDINLIEDLLRQKLKNKGKEVPGYRLYAIPYAMFKKEIRFRSHYLLADDWEVRYNFKNEKKLKLNFSWRW